MFSEWSLRCMFPSWNLGHQYWYLIVMTITFPPVCYINAIAYHFCHRQQPATILTGFIAALTLFPELLLYANSCTMMTMSSDIVIVIVWKQWTFHEYLESTAHFRIESNQSPPPMLGSGTWHNMIYTSQNNFKSSSATWNWRKLQHAAILSCWRHFCMLRLSKNCYLDDSAHELLMIPHTNFEMFDDSAQKFWKMIVQVQHPG